MPQTAHEQVKELNSVLRAPQTQQIPVQSLMEAPPSNTNNPKDPLLIFQFQTPQDNPKVADMFLLRREHIQLSCWF